MKKSFKMALKEFLAGLDRLIAREGEKVALARFKALVGRYTLSPSKAHALVEKSLLETMHRAITHSKARHLPAFTVEKLKPAMRKELNHSIFAATQLIKLNQEVAVNKTLQRFAGWMTSTSDLKDTKAVYKDISRHSFTERRLIIDQSAKLNSSIRRVLNVGNGAIAGIWHSNWRDYNYDYRPDHKARDEQFYFIRNHPAILEGFINPNASGFKYTDEITEPAEEPYCQCYYEYVFELEDIPEQFLTPAGKAALSE